MNVLATCKYRQPSAPDCPMCQSGVEDLEHFILFCPTWLHLRNEFLKCVLAVSGNGQQLRKNELHTWSPMSVGGDQLLLCFCKTYLSRQTKSVYQLDRIQLLYRSLLLLLCTWWRHQMETFSALLAICAGNSPFTGEFRAQRPVTRSFDVFFDLYPTKRLSKQSWGWWFGTP